MQAYQQVFSADLMMKPPLHVRVSINNIRNTEILLIGTSGYTYRDVSEGKHRIQVIARLNSDPQTKKKLKLQPFTIQPQPTSAPPPHVTAAAQVFNNCSARLTISANVTATFRCRINGGPWTACELDTKC